MKKFHTLFRQSVRAILSNKGRSFLTVLGIIIGIASVIALISLGEGANRMITDQISQLGTTNLIVMPGEGFGPPGSGEERNNGDRPFNPSSASSLTTKDLESLQDKTSHPTFEMVGGVISTVGVVKEGSAQQRRTINGVANENFTISNLKNKTGRLFEGADQKEKRKVAVVGSEASVELFGTVNAIGQHITINQNDFEVVGVLAKAEESRFNNFNAQLFVPLTTASEVFGASNLSNIVVKIKNADLIEEAKSDIKKTLLANHGINDEKLADFSVVSSADLLSAITKITGLLTSLLAGIAGISLVVGGIGIMNIMLVAVTERTREIGLRKAVGAKTSDILIQFLIEAVLLTLFGGVFGIALGFGIGQIVSRFLDITPVVTVNALLLAVGVSSAIGIIFGLYPASKAAKLNPIDALRYE